MTARTTLILQTAALAVVYFAAAKAGLSFALINENASAVWAPTGIAIAALLILGPRLWPGIAAGAFVANVTNSGDVPFSLVIATGNTLEALAAWYAVDRWATGAAAFHYPRCIFVFAALAGGLSTLISATTGLIALALFDDLARSDAPRVWVTWWLGDASGALVVTPVLVLWARERLHLERRPSIWELAALGMATLCAVTLVFGPYRMSDENYPTAFFMIPVMVWWAFRFGARTTATATLGVAVAAIAATSEGYGPFAQLPRNDPLILVQAFNGVVAISFLGLAAAIEQHQRTEAELRRTEGALQLAKERDEAAAALARAQAITHLGSWEWDVPGDRVTWSDEMYRVYGLNAATFAPTYAGFLEHVHSEDREYVNQVIGTALRTRSPFDFYHRVTRPDGSVRELHSQGIVVTAADGRVVRMAGTGHDITELREAERSQEALRAEQAARVEAEAALAVRDEFLSIAAHELKTPITGVHGALQLLARQLRSPGVDLARMARTLDLAERQSGRLGRLVSQLLETVRIDAGRMTITPVPADLAALVRDVTEQMSTVGEHTFEVDAPDAVAANLDPLRVEQVVANLLENAMKFSPPDSTIEVTVWSEPGSAAFSVRDRGPGIPAELREQVFDRFEQGEAGTNGGLGLGLYVARQVAIAHGGTIEVEDAPGGGARIVVRLPQASE